MDFTMSVEGVHNPSARRLEVRLPGGQVVVGTCDEAGSESYVTTDGQQVGWVEYGPLAPRAGHLVPQTTDPSWHAKLTLRERAAGRLYQPHGSIFRARKRAIVVEVGTARYAYWLRWERNRLESDDQQQRLVFRRRNSGKVEGADPVGVIELFVLLSAAGVGRHLTALSA